MRTHVVCLLPVLTCGTSSPTWRSCQIWKRPVAEDIWLPLSKQIGAKATVSHSSTEGCKFPTYNRSFRRGTDGVNATGTSADCCVGDGGAVGNVRCADDEEASESMIGRM